MSTVISAQHALKELEEKDIRAATAVAAEDPQAKKLIEDTALGIDLMGPVMARELLLKVWAWHRDRGINIEIWKGCGDGRHRRFASRNRRRKERISGFRYG